MRHLLIAFLLALLGGCPKPVQIPSSADLDAPPTITLGYMIKTYPNETPATAQSTTHSGDLNLPTDSYTRDYLITASAANPKGGVKTLSISVGGGAAITASQAPDANHMVLPSLSIIGTDGKGGTGPNGIIVHAENNTTVTVAAANFNGQTSTIAVRFNVVPGPPRIISFKATPDYINVGASSTLSWSVACGTGAAGCNVALRGADGPSYADPLLFLPALTFDGSFKVTPTRSTQTRFTLTVTNAGSERLAVSQDVVVTLYAPPSSSGLQPFYFEMRGASQVTSCFTIVVYAPDEPTAKSLAESQNGGFSATPIDAQQFAQGC